MTEDEARFAAAALADVNQTSLSQSDLESYLAGAADLLRGSIDQADFMESVNINDFLLFEACGLIGGQA